MRYLCGIRDHLYLLLRFSKLMARGRDLGTGGAGGPGTARRIPRSLRRLLRPSHATTGRESVRRRRAQRQRTQVDAADGGAAAAERCGVLSAAAALHHPLTVVRHAALDPPAGRGAGPARDATRR